MGMVVLLMRMKGAALRRSFTGPRAAVVIIGLLAAVLLAVCTLLLPLVPFTRVDIAVDVVCAALALWLVGWLAGPLVFPAEALPPEYFATLPMTRRRLAFGLLATGFVGVPGLATAIASAAVVVFAARLGPGPALVAVPAFVLQVLVVVLASKVLVRAVGTGRGSRFAREVKALAIGFGLAFVIVGPLALTFVYRQLAASWPPELAALVRGLPSGWAMVAVDATARGDGGIAVLALLGLAALCAVLLVAWVKLVDGGCARVRAGRRYPFARLRARSPLGTAIAKELRAYSAGLLRGFLVRAAFWWSLFFCVGLLLAHVSLLVPFTGVVVVIATGAVAGNYYDHERESLWLVLTSRGAEPVDTRAKQWAWVILLGPIGTGLTVLGVLWNEDPRLMPFAIAALPAVLGGAAGLIPAVAVAGLQFKFVPGLGRRVLQVQVMTVLIAVTVVPALATVAIGEVLDVGAIRWAGAVVGIATGVLSFGYLGRSAHRRLVANGLGYLARPKARPAAAAPARPVLVEATSPAAAKARARTRKPASGLALVVYFWVAGSFVFLFEGLIPLIALWAGARFVEGRFWYVPLYLPGSWQIPAALVFLLISMSMYGVAIHLTLKRRRRGNRTTAGSEQTTTELSTAA